MSRISYNHPAVPRPHSACDATSHKRPTTHRCRHSTRRTAPGRPHCIRPAAHRTPCPANNPDANVRPSHTCSSAGNRSDRRSFARRATNIACSQHVRPDCMPAVRHRTTCGRRNVRLMRTAGSGRNDRRRTPRRCARNVRRVRRHRRTMRWRWSLGW